MSKINKIQEKLFNTEEGKILCSIIIGLSLAGLVGAKCMNKHCHIYMLPDDDTGVLCKENGICYKYKPMYQQCD